MNPYQRVPLEEFCERVLRTPSLAEFQLVPEHITEALGALSNLFLEICIILGEPEIRIKTNDTFASTFVPREMLVRELRNSLGSDFDASQTVLGAVSGIVLEYFRQYEIRDVGKPLEFPGLGTLELFHSAPEPLFWLNYRDPAGRTYHRFLLQHQVEKVESQPIPRIIDIGSALRQIAEVLQPLAERRQQILHLELKGASVSSSNPKRLIRNLRRLVFNVLAATPSGRSVRIRCAEGPNRVDIELTSDVDAKQLVPTFQAQTIEDTSSGLALDTDWLRAERAELGLARQVGGGDVVILSLRVA